VFASVDPRSHGHSQRTNPLQVGLDSLPELVRVGIGVVEELREVEYFAGPGSISEPDPVIMRTKIRPESVRLNMEYAGYLTPTPSFQDAISGGMTYVRSVYIELTNIAFQVGAVVDELEYLFKPGPAPPPALRPSAER
jgi:hypothetical protein